MPVSRAWPAYIGEFGRCLRPSLGSARCFLEVCEGKVGNQTNLMEITYQEEAVCDG